MMRPTALLLLSALGACAQPPSSAVLMFHFERPGLPVPEYTLTVHEDGSGTYAATYTAPPPDPHSGSSYVAAQAAAAPTQVARPILLSAPTTARLFERVRSTNQLRDGCESRDKNIANTGAKTLTYTGPEGSAHCTYNYTENKAIASMTETFQGIAQTLDDGRSIELLHRYDRLGLDRELSNLADAVREGRAIEVATIAPVLQSLCDDSQVMERVRKRAAGLNALGGSVKRCSTSAYIWVVAESSPYSRTPGCAATRSQTSRCIISTARLSLPCAAAANKCSRISDVM